MKRVRIIDISKTSTEILRKIGVPQEEVDIIVDTIIYAHLRNKGTHGIGRIPIYISKIQEGLMSAKTELIEMKDSPVISIYNAGNGFGQIAAYKGMSIAIKKAQKFGVGIVGIRNSNNFGTAGYFVDYAAKKNMMAFIFANSAPAIAPTGGTKAILGTNPIGIGCPGGNEKSTVILDMACSIAARGKIRLAAKNGESIPDDWALDANGISTTDPYEALKGTLNPIGGHKGYGLSLFVDIIAGILTGAAYGGDVKPLNHASEVANNGHFILVLNIEYFQHLTEFKSKMDYLTDNIKSCGDKHHIRLPGEGGNNCINEYSETITISEKQVEEINSLASKLSVNSRLICDL